MTNRRKNKIKINRETDKRREADKERRAQKVRRGRMETEK